jgi:hypothetical protein
VARSPLLKTFGAAASGSFASVAAVRRSLTRSHRQHRHRADQQPQRPNRAAVGIHATGCRHHLLFAFATESADGFAQRDIRRALPALLRQRLKRGVRLWAERSISASVKS